MGRPLLTLVPLLPNASFSSRPSCSCPRRCVTWSCALPPYFAGKSQTNAGKLPFPWWTHVHASLATVCWWEPVRGMANRLVESTLAVVLPAAPCAISLSKRRAPARGDATVLLHLLICILRCPSSHRLPLPCDARPPPNHFGRLTCVCVCVLHSLAL